MYRHLYVAVDASEHAAAAVGLALELARTLGSRLTAAHVYAGRLHEARFRQMEYTLPERYREEAELERQREVHESLIARGLRLISESYLDGPARQAAAAGVPLERRVLDGKHYQALAEDVGASDADLVVLGALGMGAVKESVIGSVAERLVRRLDRDALVVRPPDAAAGGEAPILVGLDGSPQSWGAFRAALALGRALSRPVEAAAVYDPYLHYALFKSIVRVLSAEASRVFRFAEQEALHEEIIDGGLARIYQSHLEVARRLAGEAGLHLGTHLLQGKGFEKLLQHCRATPPWLLVLGRSGFHSDPGARELGSNSENLLRLAPCNVLLTAGCFEPPEDLLAEETVAWTREALSRMERVPRGVQRIARAALLRHAREQGHTVITAQVIDQAMARFMPGAGARRLQQLAEELALRGAREDLAWVCGACGHAARAPDRPVRCAVCGGGVEGFRATDRRAVAEAAAAEGGVTQEEALPGLTVGWSAEARQALEGLAPGVSRRQVEARAEKRARLLRLPAVTRELVHEVAAEAAGPLPWTAEARARLGRVPAGFMREATRQEVERAAREAGAAEVDLSRCEAVIARLRATMCPAAASGPAPGAAPPGEGPA